MRKIVEALTAAEDGTLTRAQLEDALVPLGFRSDNILRSIRALDRNHIVRLKEGRFAETSKVILAQPIETPIPEDEILAMLRSMS